MTDLIERLEKEGGSRKLDWAIECELGPSHVDDIRARNRDFGLREPRKTGAGQWDIPYPEYTLSLEHATMLAERSCGTRNQFIDVFKMAVDQWASDESLDLRSLPKYVIIALLRALEDGK